jgi:hypothetical protein
MTDTKSAVPEFTLCEDAVFWDHVSDQGKFMTRVVITSCDPGRENWNTVMGPLRDPEPRGALWLYGPGIPPQRITLEGFPDTHDFHPLGIDISTSHGDEDSILYAVNHARNATVIEQFSLSPYHPTRARWVRTISHPSAFKSANSVAITGKDEFYVTNDHYFTRRLPSPFGHILPMVESVLALPGGWVSHITLTSAGTVEDNLDTSAVQKSSVVAPLIPFANGVSLSPDGRTLAVASSSTSRVYFFSRDPTTNALTPTESVTLNFAPDNVAFSDAGSDGRNRVVVAGHPSFPSLIKRAEKKADSAPSWVVEVTLPPPVNSSEHASTHHVVTDDVNELPPGYSLRTLLQTDGPAFGTCSTGLVDERTGTMYFVGLYETGLLVCKPT